ncbi:MAG: uroporphyrinogen decarboxylase family protein, partial [bacterium]
INLKEYLGIEIEEELNPGGWTTVPVHPVVMDRLGLDIVHVAPGKPKNWTPRTFPDGSVEDEWGVRRKMVWHGTSYYNEIVYQPLVDATIDDLKDYPWPDPDDPGRTEGLAERVKKIYEETDYAIMARFGGSVNDGCWYMRGQEQWLMDYVLNQDFVETMLDKMLDITLRINENCLRAAGKYIDILRLGGEDMGTQQNLIISPEMLRKIWFPRLKKLVQRTKEIFHEYNPNGKIMLHSCGAIYPIIEDLIDCGIDILDPIQPKAKGMDPFRLKAEFGDRLAFHGGICIQDVLPNYEPEEVVEFVKERLRALAPGGGYIVSPSHNVPEDSKPENLTAMCDAVREYGRYPLQI